MANQDSARINLEDIVAAAGQGAVRALAARKQSDSGNTAFYIELLVRCGIPPVTVRAAGSVESEDEIRRGPRPEGGHNKD